MRRGWSSTALWYHNCSCTTYCADIYTWCIVAMCLPLITYVALGTWKGWVYILPQAPYTSAFYISWLCSQFIHAVITFNAQSKCNSHKIVIFKEKWAASGGTQNYRHSWHGRLQKWVGMPSLHGPQFFWKARPFYQNIMCFWLWSL